MPIAPHDQDGIPTITPQSTTDVAGRRLIDVRMPDEYVGELGHIEGAELVTLGPDLEQFLLGAEKTQDLLFICKAGGRSARATAFAQSLGFTNVVNMAGGMLRWNQLGLPVTR